MLPITIRPMSKKDIPEVLSIEQASFPSPWTEGMFLQEVRDNRLSHFVVAQYKEEIVGYAGFWIVLDEAHLVNLAVAPAYRNQGIGRQLLMVILKIAINKGAQKATLEVRASNLNARKFYQRFSFKPVAVRKGYYHSREDAVIMWRDDLKEGNEDSISGH